MTIIAIVVVGFVCVVWLLCIGASLAFHEDIVERDNQHYRKGDK